MGSMFSILYSIVLVGAGVYAILLGNDLLPKSKEIPEEDSAQKPFMSRIQFTIAGIILIYFGLSTLYTLYM